MDACDEALNRPRRVRVSHSDSSSPGATAVSAPSAPSSGSSTSPASRVSPSVCSASASGSPSGSPSASPGASSPLLPASSPSSAPSFGPSSVLGVVVRGCLRLVGRIRRGGALDRGVLRGCLGLHGRLDRSVLRDRRRFLRLCHRASKNGTQFLEAPSRSRRPPRAKQV